MRRGAVRGRLGFIIGALLALFVTNAAWGQSPDFPSAQVESVTGRQRTDFQSLGIEVGNFILHGALQGEGEYDSNVFLTPSAQGDFVRRLRPSLGLAGEVSDTTIQVNADAESAWYKKYHANNYIDFNAVASAKHDITDESNITLTAREARIHEMRGTVNDPGTACGPNQYDLTVFTAQPQFSAAPYIGSFKLEGRYFDWLTNCGFSNTDRSNRQLYANTREGYQFDNGLTAFVEPSYEIHQFIKRFDRDHINHNSQTYQGLLGLSYDALQNANIEFSAGYFYETFFDRNQFLGTEKIPGTFSGWSVQGTGLWNFTEDMTLTGSVSRTNSDVLPFNFTIDTTIDETTAALLRLDWETTDHLVTYVGGNLAFDDYPGTSLSENTLSLNVGGTYYVNQYLSFEVQYVYAIRNSSLSTRNYTDNQVFFRVNGQY